MLLHIGIWNGSGYLKTPSDQMETPTPSSKPFDLTEERKALVETLRVWLRTLIPPRGLPLTRIPERDDRSTDHVIIDFDLDCESAGDERVART